MNPRPICADCPDLESCHTGASCEYVRGVEAFFIQYDNNLKGKTKMTTAKKTTVIASDVVDQAVEEKLVVVPAQSEGEKTVEEADNLQKDADDVDGSLEDGKDKISLKNRLSGVVSKVKANKKAVGVTVVAVGVGLYALAKIAAKKAVEETLNTEIVEPADSDTETVTADIAV